MAATASSAPADLEIARLPLDRVAGCVVCAFTAANVERRVVFLFAEKIGETWFLDAMRRGGFCVQHGRHIFRHPSAPAMTMPYRELLQAWLGRQWPGAPPAPIPAIGRGCPLCETAAWAEGHALGLLADPLPGKARSTLGAEGPVCMPHIDGLLDVVGVAQIPSVVARLRARWNEAVTADVAGALVATAGEDPDAAVRPSGSPRGVQQRRATRREPATDLVERALDAGACPICEAARVAVAWPIGWLADAPEGQDLRDLDRLCRRHLHDAAAVSAGAARHAVGGSLRAWQGTLNSLPGAASIPPSGLRERAARLLPRLAPSSRRSGRGQRRVVERLVASARLRRERRCVACEAAATADAQTTQFLAALLASRPWRERFERSGGVCLRHAAARYEALGPKAAEVVLRVADALAARHAWELGEAMRVGSWSVRYEPRGGEAMAWERAMVLVLGETVRRRWLLGPDGDGEEPAA